MASNSRLYLAASAPSPPGSLAKKDGKSLHATSTSKCCDRCTQNDTAVVIILSRYKNPSPSREPISGTRVGHLDERACAFLCHVPKLFRTCQCACFNFRIANRNLLQKYLFLIVQALRYKNWKIFPEFPIDNLMYFRVSCGIALGTCPD